MILKTYDSPKCLYERHFNNTFSANLVLFFPINENRNAYSFPSYLSKLDVVV